MRQQVYPGFYCAFKYTLNSDPLPGWLSNNIFPPPLFAISFTKYNPTPEPSMEFSNRKYFENITSCLIASMPTPLSFTESADVP